MSRLVSRRGSFPVAVGALVGGGLAAESVAGPPAALGLAAATWLVLLAGCSGRLPRERRRVAALVLVATAGEVLGSIVLGLYAYRSGGIPPFVPPGHGVIFLAGLRLAGSAPVRRRPGLAPAAAIGATVALSLAGPVGDDTGGVLAAGLLIAVLLRARGAPLFACMVLLVDALELYGTAIGTWRWDSSWSGLTLGNPPAGVALGYVAFDWLALRLVAWRGLRRPTRPPPTDAAEQRPAGAPGLAVPGTAAPGTAAPGTAAPGTGLATVHLCRPQPRPRRRHPARRT